MAARGSGVGETTEQKSDGVGKGKGIDAPPQGRKQQPHPNPSLAVRLQNRTDPAPTRRPGLRSIGAMALRSLVLKMKAAVPLLLPRGVVPRSGTSFAAPKPKPEPKDDILNRLQAECEKARQEGCSEEIINQRLHDMMEKESKPMRDKLARETWFYRVLGLLVTAGGFGSIAYFRK